MLCSAAITSFSTRFPVGLTQETYRYNVKNAYEKGVQKKSALLFQRVKKANGFFARFKYATFFVKLTLHEKSRFARQKA